MRIEGLDGAIGTTPNHPFWSEDRQTFVRADELESGETLRTPNGTAKVQSLSQRPGRDMVFNLEVQADHVYHVSSTGVLVHNGGGKKSCLAALDAIENGDLRVVSPRSAVVTQFGTEKHHLFTQGRKKWFKKEYDLDVDEHVIDIDRNTHEALHAGKKALGNKGGWWDHDLMERIGKAERVKGGKLTQAELIGEMKEMLQRFKLDQLPWHRYSGH
ncbi:MAG: polymorphic toxin-type HINT domain-containing protein [Planctomycetaceae bacterium]